MRHPDWLIRLNFRLRVSDYFRIDSQQDSCISTSKMIRSILVQTKNKPKLQTDMSSILHFLSTEGLRSVFEVFFFRLRLVRILVS